MDSNLDNNVLRKKFGKSCLKIKPGISSGSCVVIGENKETGKFYAITNAHVMNPHVTLSEYLKMNILALVCQFLIKILMFISTPIRSKVYFSDENGIVKSKAKFKKIAISSDHDLALVEFDSKSMMDVEVANIRENDLSVDEQFYTCGYIGVRNYKMNFNEMHFINKNGSDVNFSFDRSIDYNYISLLSKLFGMTKVLGMSGGGTFDSAGKFCGITYGGYEEKNIASALSLKCVLEFINEVKSSKKINFSLA